MPSVGGWSSPDPPTPKKTIKCGTQGAPKPTMASWRPRRVLPPMLMMLMVRFGVGHAFLDLGRHLARRILPCRIMDGGTPLLQVRDQCIDISVGQAEVGHAHLVLREEPLGDGVVRSPQPLRGLNVTKEPGAVASGRHAPQVRPHLVAFPKRCGRRRTCCRRRTPQGGCRADAPARSSCPASIAQKGVDLRGEEARVVHGGVPHPLAARLVADREGRAWPSRLFASFVDDSPSFLRIRSMSFFCPVRNSQPGPVSNFSA